MSKLLMFQFTHPGRGATDTRHLSRIVYRVSIHAPREGCDSQRPPWRRRIRCFNSRTPGGVRPGGSLKDRDASCFNSRTPGGVRPQFFQLGDVEVAVSIHAPREGCDLAQAVNVDPFALFQFTHPGRGATTAGALCLDLLLVSIHAPREGCDRTTKRTKYVHCGFNSRTPGGVRRLAYQPTSNRY